MFGLGPTELIVIMVLALIVLGPQRIPDVATSLGKAIRSFRKATRELRDQIDIEDDVRRPFEDLHAALRDEPPRQHRPVLPPQLLTAPGDPNFPVLGHDPNYHTVGHGSVGAPVFAPHGPDLHDAVGHDELGGHHGHPEGTAAAHAGEGSPAAPPAASAAPAPLAAPPAEPVVSAASGADHFRRASEGEGDHRPGGKGAS
jgi:TatA/E family protein of Tat protein translocase